MDRNARSPVAAIEDQLRSIPRLTTRKTVDLKVFVVIGDFARRPKCPVPAHTEALGRERRQSKISRYPNYGARK
jgi:hypothetical protein